MRRFQLFFEKLIVIFSFTPPSLFNFSREPDNPNYSPIKKNQVKRFSHFNSITI